MIPLAAYQSASNSLTKLNGSLSLKKNGHVSYFLRLSYSAQVIKPSYYTASMIHPNEWMMKVQKGHFNE